MLNKRVSVIGLGYGDEGKGTIAEYMSRRNEASAIVRHCGGPQNMHHVVDDNDVVHCFTQFGAGTLLNHGLRTYLSKYVFVDPYRITQESNKLRKLGVKDPLHHLWVDPECIVVTPIHRFINQIRDARISAVRVVDINNTPIRTTNNNRQQTSAAYHHRSWIV